ncbi:Formiminoglutamic iminohydrolase [Rhodovastum atsumiense]|uniref:Formimidoylglutamate deiminase n=1 Tax=Rhodovastum atsumiense TaxID=504468 RepID=A0A5M6ITQ4_9PROT|nr:formimidoylglutamate deiminase [Rhodovastum atsumiense]KAA5611700.1 formimidoylglutamate deiminase [Rhodovastum atsumiense]CAH2604276.1 Formiminoglutamic iminohydrolase [Rhodovastum atsumiense]
MTAYVAELAWVDGAIQPDVGLEVDPSGYLVSVTPGAGTGTGERIPGLVVPGLGNLHSHAFQRAMAGLAERAGPEGDDFWRWREVMYRFLGALTPEDVQAIAAMLYAECLRHGYTAVAEFHYLHNAPDGTPYADPAEMARRILAAATDTGIGLTLLPVLYRHGGFGAAPPGPGQRRFLMDIDAYARLCQDLAAVARIGVAPHSLRAVTPEELHAALAIADALGAATPVHIHIAEQEREVADCLAWSGQRPVEWLLAHAPVGPRWCLVHATHISAPESTGLAASGAVAGLCQTTEANLGDGIFPLLPWLDARGRFGIGTDSNVSTSPVEELRWLEYTQRLTRRRRNVTATRAGASVAANLLSTAASGGAQALGRQAGAIAAGRLADLVVLDTDHPALVGRSGESLLDAWLFSGNSSPVRHVMVAGRWVIRDGRHPRDTEITAAFAGTMRRLAAAL